MTTIRAIGWCVAIWVGAGAAIGSTHDPRERAPAGQRGPGPEHVVDTGELMQLFLRPAYEELRSAVARPPATRPEWAAIYRTSVRLAEMENLLFFREPNRYTSDARFPILAAAARQAAVGVVTATLAGMRNTTPADYEAVRRAYGAVSASCNACHRGLDTMNGPDIKP